MSIRLFLPLLAAGCLKAPAQTGPPTPPALVCGEMADGSHTFGVLHLNDVYRIEGLLDGRGGLARVATLRAELEETCPDLLLTHGGDLLSPSLLSKSTNDEDPDNKRKVRFYGAHMVDILSRLDGDPSAFDPHMFVAIGNHEFDQSDAGFAPTLDRLFEASGFTWLDTGLAWTDGAVAADNLVDTHVVNIAGVDVGLFGVTIDKPKMPYVTTDPDYVSVATAAIAALEAQEPDVILGITHLDISDDLALLEAIPEHPHLILGGHNHTAMTRTSSDGRLVLKGDADAARVRIAYVTVDKDGGVSVRTDVVGDDGTPLDPTTPKHPAVQGAVEGWLSALDALFCGVDQLGCLGEELTVTNTTLVAEELKIRRYETNLGDWLLDEALAVFADHEPDLAFMNSGSLRLNQDIAAGTPIPRQVVEELFPYSSPLHLIEVKGADILGVAARSVEAWEGNGHWLQVGGWGFHHDPDAEDPAQRATKVSLLPAGGDAVAIDPDKVYRVVVNDYLISDRYDRDGYTFDFTKIDTPEDGTDLKQVVTGLLRDAGDAGISLAVDGRICNAQEAAKADPPPCRIP